MNTKVSCIRLMDRINSKLGSDDFIKLDFDNDYIEVADDDNGYIISCDDANEMYNTLDSILGGIELAEYAESLRG